MDGDTTRTEALIRAVRARIATRALAPGDRLPSVRRFAETMGVSPSTVVEAYARLEAEGVIRARRGSGFYVTGAGLPPLSLSGWDRAASATSTPSGFRGSRSTPTRRC